MADRHSSIVTNDNLLASYFEKRAMATMDEMVYYRQLATVYPLPLGSGKQVTWNAWRRIAAASGTLAEASSNAAIQLSSRKINVSIDSYGRCVKLTDLLEKTSILPVETGALERLEQCAALTVDNVCQYAIFKAALTQCGLDGADTKTVLLSVYMSSVASAFCANTGTMNLSNLQFGFPAVFGASVGKLSAVSKTAPSISARFGPIGVNKAVARLRRFSVRPFADGKFAGVVHPNAWADGLANASLQQWHLNYAEGPRDTMMKHEVGTIHGVRFIESPNAPRYAVAAHSVNAIFIAGPDALGVTELGGGVEYIITRPSGGSTNDPFHLNSYVAFKIRMAAKALNPSAGCILWCHEKSGL